MDINQQRYEVCYKELVRKYLNDLKAKFPKEEYQPIPNLFLPAWGKTYFDSKVRMVFVGRDTHSWGKGLQSMIEEVDADDWVNTFDMQEFQNLNYIDWGSKTRYKFWGFVLYFLAWLYGLENWGLLKSKQYHRDMLSSFGWGNTNSIERCDSQVIKKALSDKRLKMGVYNFAKEESRVFDDFSLMQKVMAPDVVFIMCLKADANQYLSKVDKKLLEEESDGDALRVFLVGKTLVINIPHPQAIMRRRDDRKADFYVKKLKELLVRHNLFVPLKDFFREDQKMANEFLSKFSVGLKAKAGLTRDAVRLMAIELRKQNATMTVEMLCEILNREKYTTTSGGKYLGERGSYRMLSKWYTYFEERGDYEVAEAIALAFTKGDGSYAYK